MKADPRSRLRTEGFHPLQRFFILPPDLDSTNLFPNLLKSSLRSLPPPTHCRVTALGFRIWSVAALALVLVGCASSGFDTWYRITVDGDAASHPASMTNWPSLSSLPATPSKPSRKFADTNLTAEWHLWDWSMKLVIKNKTDQPLSILWPEARVAWDSREDSLQLTQQPRPATQKQRPENTLVPPGKSATCRAFPRPLLRWNSWGDAAEGRGHWMPAGVSSPVFGRSYPPHQNKTDRQRMAREAVGHEVMILLPLVIRGERITYTFRLKITGANSYQPLELL